MTWSLRTAFAILIIMLLAPLAAAQDGTSQGSPANAPVLADASEAFSAAQARAIETIVKNYLVQHPEVLQDAMEALDRRQKEA